MGCFESFSANMECVCGYTWYEMNIQSKDFDCVLDHLTEGEPTWILRDSYILEDTSLITDNLTRAQVEEKYGDPKKYKVIWGDNDEYWYAYRYLGKKKTCFDGIKNKDFNCYVTCPECKKWLELIGHIKDYIFIGVEVESYK